MKAGQNNKYYITITPGFCACLFGKVQLILEEIFPVFKYSKSKRIFLNICALALYYVNWGLFTIIK